MTDSKDRSTAKSLQRRRDIAGVSDAVLKGAGVLAISAYAFVEGASTIGDGGVFILIGLLAAITAITMFIIGIMSLASAASGLVDQITDESSEGRFNELLIKWGGWIFSVLVSATVITLGHRYGVILVPW